MRRACGCGDGRGRRALSAQRGPGARRRLVGLAAGPLLFALVLAWPLDGLSSAAHLLAAIFAWAVVYWLSEALPAAVTAWIWSASS
jgi:hypothetical protein